MTILIDARPLVDPSLGGVRRLTFELLKAYTSTFPEDRLLFVTTGRAQLPLPAPFNTMTNVVHIHLRIPNKLWSILSCLKLVSLTRAVSRRGHQFDALFFPNIGFMGTTPRDYSLLIHDLSFLIEPRWFSLKGRLWHHAVHARTLIQHAQILFAVSETTNKDAIQLLGIAEERIHVLPLGSTLHREVTQTNIPKPATLPSKYILAMGLNDARKNVHTVIDAVTQLRQEEDLKDLELIIIGSPEKHPTRQPIDWIHVAVRPSDDDLALLYRFASAFAYPSWYEGYGFPLHEAASFGTPCIASTAGALPETAPPGTIFANPAKPHHWVEGLKQILSKPRSGTRTTKRSWTGAARTVRETLMGQKQ